jgi:RimJ/RimL family protein N-acetyltransferase
MSVHRLKNGETLLIRSLTGADAPAMIEYLKAVGGESDNLTFGAEGIPMTLEQETAFLDGLKTNPNTIMIAGFIDGNLVSAGNLSASPRVRMRHNATLGISVRKGVWNQGVATKMIEQMIELARNSEFIEIVNLRVREDNVPAIHLYEKLGFFHTGRVYKEFHVGGVYYDTLIMSLDLSKQLGKEEKTT